MELTKFIDRAAPLGVLGVMISQQGELIAEKYLDEPCRRNIYSASKSVTACAVGFAVQEGLLSLDEKLVEAFPEELPERISDHLRRAAVHDLLTMALGQEHGFLMGAQRWELGREDWVRAALEQPFVYAPGEKFVYNNVGPYLAGILVQRRAGCDLVAYLMPRLFQPLGIQRPTWETDPTGSTFGAGGLMLTLPEMHRLGVMWQQGGMWQGQRVMDKGWLDLCSQKHSAGGAFGYGYLFWHGPHGSWRADGKYCQIISLYPQQQAVATIQAECRDGEALMKAIDEEIYPQLS